VKRTWVDRQVEEAIAPMLTAGERFERSGPTWAVERRGRTPLLFRARDLHRLVLTDQRLLLFRRPRRRRPPTPEDLVLAKRFPTFQLDRVRRLRPMLQLRLRTAADLGIVLEFRPRQRSLGRDLEDRVGERRPGGRRSPLALPPGDDFPGPRPR
jgi:hypothetical protein